jgi:hypothetical protein
MAYVANCARTGNGANHAAAGLAQPVVTDPDGRFSRNYNRASFMFQHELTGHPLFDIPNLIDLSRRQAERPGFAYWSNGKVDVGDRWEKGASEQQSLPDTIRDIADNDSLVMLKRTELDPIFGPVLRDLLSRMVELSGDRMRNDVTIGRTTILIASPRRITAYHMDADTNFLLQLAGDKTLSVFDQTDRTLVTDEELERYHAGDANGATFKTARQGDARSYDLRAGFGVHIPSTAPHWAQNGNSVSVALSINYDLRSVQRSALIYRMNRRLRRFGVAPTPPGISGWRDHLKAAAANGLGGVHQLYRRGLGSASLTGRAPPSA